MQTQDWLFVGIFIALAPLFPLIALLIPKIIAPKKPNPIKMETYECGIEAIGPAWVQFKAPYYIFALIFLVFDVEMVFLYPWAASLNLLPLYAVIEGIIFVAILFAGLLYAWRNGALQWA